MQESHTEGMVSKEWIQATRTYFLDFLHTTGFPELQRHGERGLLCAYPEWLIMLIGVLAVKCKAKTYVGIHRLSTRYWQELCGQDVILPPISESQLRERLKKICFEPGTGAACMHHIFCARSRGSTPWQTQVMALGGPLLSHFPLDPIA